MKEPLDPAIEAHHARRRSWRDLFEATQEALFILDAATGRILDVNQRAQEMFGFSREYALEPGAMEKHLAEPPYSHPEALAWIRKSVESGPQLFEWLAARKNGERFWCEVSLCRLNGGGHPEVLAVVRDISARKEAEYRLKFQAMLLDQIVDTVTATDLQGRITFVNEAQCRALNRRKGELIGASVEIYGDDPERGGTQRQIIEKTRAEGTWRGEVINRDCAGREMLVDCRTTLIRDTSGQAIGMCGVATDITGRKRAEEALRQAHQRERLHFDQTPLGVIEWDLDFRVTRWNPAAERVFGYSADAALGQHASFIVPETARVSVDGLWRLLLSRQGGERSTNENIHKDGHVIFCEWYNTPLMDQRGQVIGVASLVMDVTDRRRAESQLMESERRYHSFFDMSPAGIMLEDSEANILEVNAAMCRIFGYPREELRGRNVRMLVPPDHLPEMERHIRELLAGKTLLHEMDNITKDGRPLRVEIHEMSVPLPDGRRGILAVVNDITERRQLEQQLRHLQKMESVGRLASGVAHDFNNILTVIKGSASILAELPVDSSAHQEWVAQIISAADRAANLTRQLLLFSRRQHMKLQAVNLNELTANLTKMLGRMLGEDITLEFDYENDLPAVQGDPGMLEQVIMNLAVNARDAMPQGGRLQISTSVADFPFHPDAQEPNLRAGKCVRLTVRDTGCGIPPEIRDRIFEPFFTTKEVGKGTGLGLATVYGIIAQHGGWLDLESTPEQGTSFFIYLPTTLDSQLEITAMAAPLIVTGRGETILIVEDERTVLDLIQRTLSRQGYRVMVADSGVKAAQLPHEQLDRVDLLITDIVMPGGINGRELAEGLRRRFPRLRVIYCSGYSEETSVGRVALEPGFSFIQKPFSLHDLLVAVADALR